MPAKRSKQRILLTSSPNYHDGEHCGDHECTLYRHVDNQQTMSELLPAPPINWPQEVIYLSLPVQSPYLTNAQKQWLRHKPRPLVDTEGLPVVRLPLNRAEIDRILEVQFIDDEHHPAYGQRGLFAARDLGPEELIVPYIGYVHSSSASERTVCDQRKKTLQQKDKTDIDDENITGPSFRLDREQASVVDGQSPTTPTPAIGSWDLSSYDLNLYRDDDIELAVDAANSGNEARFCNDYRGVPAKRAAEATNGGWERSKKRAAKSWSTSDQNSNISQGFAKPEKPMAIPNAEFRDIWFEWTAEDDVGLTEHNVTTKDAGGDLEQLIPDDKTSGTKHSRRKARRKKIGMRGVAIFVMPAGRAGKRKDGIKSGQEILVSYGKGFWSHHGFRQADALKEESYQTQNAG